MRPNMAPKVLSVSQNQHFAATRSVERVLEDSIFSGEILLCGRKLKDFPKVAAGHHSLEDTVFADLSRNRFTELPEEVTSFIFLETLLLSQCVLRTIPDTVRSLTSLSFLDLRNNQLTTLPRELCLLPLKILLVSNNRLIQLPDELGRMDKLTELDACCNQLAHLPNRMAELRQLRALLLANNQLVYIPREVASLQLVTLDVSGNRIGKLPTELRQMTSLVNLELENNPLTCPPANLCARGIVHVFKFLEIVASKDEKRTAAGSSISADASVRRNVSNPTHSLKLNGSNANSVNLLLEQRKKQSWDGANNGRSLEHIDKQWSAQEDKDTVSPKWSPMHTKATILEAANGSQDLSSPVDEKRTSAGPPSNMQTYREYKEALKQQRNQDTTAVYRSKDNTSSSGASSSSGGSNEASPMSPVNGNKSLTTDVITIRPKTIMSKEVGGGKLQLQQERESSAELELENSKNNNSNGAGNGSGGGGYVKPASPMGVTKNAIARAGGGDATDSVVIKSIMNGSTRGGKNGDNNGKTGTSMATTTTGAKNPKRTVSWNRDIVTPEKNISFTMRREFDRHKEEAELTGKLRNILESRLKMTLPQDMAPALADGVVLCHLANNVRPRSVASIHVPSPAVPKLTMARCRRNVDNFLDACRKLGVDDESLSSCEDILSLTSSDETKDATEEEEDGLNAADSRLDTLKTLTETVMSMIECSSKATKRLQGTTVTPRGRTWWPPQLQQRETKEISSATKKKSQEPLNAQNSIQREEEAAAEERLDVEFQGENNYENYVNYFRSKGILFPRSVWSNLKREYDVSDTSGCEKNVIYQRDNKQRMGLKLALNLEELLVTRGGGGEGGSNEDCVYDSERGKFNCDNVGVGEEREGVNLLIDKKEVDVNFNVNNVLGADQKGVRLLNKKIEYFENKLKPSKEDNRTKAISTWTSEKEERLLKTPNEIGDKKLINILCLGGFFVTALFLYLFPLPN